MRSTLEIILACKDQQPCSEEELRLAVVALAAMETMDRQTIRDLADAVLDGKPSAFLRAGFVKKELEIRFKGMKMPVDQYLGPAFTPGTPENQASDPPGWVWVLGFAIGGCEWAIEEVGKSGFWDVISKWKGVSHEHEKAIDAGQALEDHSA